ncbi:ABC transporter permease [Paenibacillus sp. BR2-3]|uniref:ABC transporter permease n=1 Tax=Paenibacillus sp. BR2-3 TaxID=3048494 RepID=UPI003977BA96
MNPITQSIRAIRIGKSIVIYAFLWGFALFILSPLAVILVSAFGEGWFGARWLPQNWTLRWFEWAFQMTDLVQVTINSMIIAALTIIISLLIGIPTAWAIGKRKIRAKELLIALILLPRMIPELTYALGTAKIFYTIDLINTHFGVALAHSTITIPYVVLIMSSTFEALDQRVIDAGGVCGANWIQRFLYLILPMSMPGIMAAVIFAFVTSFNEFTLSMMTYGPQTVTLPIQTYLSIGDGYKEIASAVSFVLLIPSILILGVIVKQIKPENLNGGVKGL